MESERIEGDEGQYLARAQHVVEAWLDQAVPPIYLQGWHEEALVFRIATALKEEARRGE